MGRIWIAWRALVAALFDSEKATLIQKVLDGGVLPKIDREAELQRPVSVEPARGGRSEAITLLSALQREARFVDLAKQPLGQFTDEQIGGAARNVLTDCAAVLERFFSLRPVVDAEEGAASEVPGGYDPARYKLSGTVHGSGPFRGKLAHPGWQATAVKLPAWTGSKDASLVIAPAEVEVDSIPGPSS